MTYKEIDARYDWKDEEDFLTLEDMILFCREFLVKYDETFQTNSNDKPSSIVIRPRTKTINASYTTSYLEELQLAENPSEKNLFYEAMHHSLMSTFTDILIKEFPNVVSSEKNMQDGTTQFKMSAEFVVPDETKHFPVLKHGPIYNDMDVV